MADNFKGGGLTNAGFQFFSGGNASENDVNATINDANIAGRAWTKDAAGNMVPLFAFPRPEA